MNCLLLYFCCLLEGDFMLEVCWLLCDEMVELVKGVIGM